MKHSVAADAAFLRQHQNENSNVLELQQDSLLHLQVAALLEECGAPKRFTEQATAWAASVCSCVFEDDGDGGTAPLPFTNSALNEAHRTAPWNRSHKSHKSTQQEGKQTLFQDEDEEEATKLGHKLRILHPSKHLLDEEASLLLKASSNAHVLPTLERTVLLPCSLWRAHDYRRGRYFEKRNAVVWHVAQYLATKTEQQTVEQKNKTHKRKKPKKQQQGKQSAASDAAVGISHVMWRFHCHDRRKVILLLLPSAGKSGKPKFRLQLNFEMESIDWIPRLRLVPNRNNLGTTNNTTNATEGDNCNSESILYNHCLTEDALHLFSPRSNDENTMLPSNCFSALKLLHIWCLQRGFLRGHDTLESVQLQAMITYLYRAHRIHTRTAPLQVVTACWKWWSEFVMDCSDNKTNKSVWVVPLPNQSESQTIAQSSLAQLYEQQTRESPLTDHDPSTLVELYQQPLNGLPVLLDSSLTHNYFGRWSPAFACALQRQSKKSLDCATQPQSPAFHHLFLTRTRFWDSYDAYLRIPLDDLIQKQSSSSDTNGSYEVLTGQLLDMLHRALGDRVRLLRCHTTGNGIRGQSTDTAAAMGDSDEIPTYSVNEPLPVNILRTSPTGSNALVLGITVNPDTCFRVVDAGTV